MRLTFSEREKQVWAATARGLGTKEIAAAVGVAHGTVNAIRRTLHAELGVNNRVELTHLAILHGVIDPPAPLPAAERHRFVPTRDWGRMPRAVTPATAIL